MGDAITDLSQAIYWRRTGRHMSSLDAAARIEDYIRTIQAVCEPLTDQQITHLREVLG